MESALDERCADANCGICLYGRDYRAMRWVPIPMLTLYSTHDQASGRNWWFVTMDDLKEAVSRHWP